PIALTPLSYFFYLSPYSPFLFFFFNDTAPTEIYTLSLHDALPISDGSPRLSRPRQCSRAPRKYRRTRESRPGTGWSRAARARVRSEEHTSELQSPCNLVCRLLLEKKKKKKNKKKK